MARLISECLTDMNRLEEVASLSSSFSSEDTDLYISLINAASKMILSYTKRLSFKYHTVSDELHDGQGMDTILTNYRPIISITSLYDDTAHNYTSSSIIDTDDYEINHANAGIVRLIDGSVFSDSKSNVQISYVSGYSDLPVYSYSLVFNEGGSDLTATITSGNYNSSSLATEIQTQLRATAAEQEDETSQDAGSYDASSDNNRITLDSGFLVADALIGDYFTFDATSSSTEAGNTYEITDNDTDWIEIDHTLTGAETVTEWNTKYKYDVTFSETTQKYTITSSGSSFTICWTQSVDLAYLIGYAYSDDDIGATSYVSDYPILGVPEDIIEACNTLVRWRHSEAKLNRVGLFADNQGGFDFSTTPALIFDLMKPYAVRVR